MTRCRKLGGRNIDEETVDAFFKGGRRGDRRIVLGDSWRLGVILTEVVCSEAEGGLEPV